MPVEYYDASESSKHSDIDTLHGKRDCHHLSGADYVFGVRDADASINRCGTCGNSDLEADETDADAE